MNNIWFFGDCFTWGYNCRPKYEYYQKYKKVGDKLWTKIVSEKIGYNNVDKSVPLYGTNYDSIKCLIENLENIRKNDIIIYGTTPPIGFLKLNKSKKKVNGITTYEWEKEINWRDDEEKNICIPFQKLNHSEEHLKLWMEYFLPQIKSLAFLLLKSKNVKTYLWSYEIYHNEKKFETISQHTMGRIDDYHFSWEGHRQMADYILTKINNDDYLKPTII